MSVSWGSASVPPSLLFKPVRCLLDFRCIFLTQYSTVIQFAVAPEYMGKFLYIIVWVVAYSRFSYSSCYRPSYYVQIRRWRSRVSTSILSPLDVWLNTKLESTAIATAIYVAKLAIFLPQGLTQVAVTNGISSASIPGFIAAISAKNSTAALAISGVTPTIFAEGLAARAEAYSNSFHYIWYVQLYLYRLGAYKNQRYTNLPFVCVALISMIALKYVFLSTRKELLN